MKKNKIAKYVAAFVTVFCTLISNGTAFAADDVPDYRLAITPTQKNLSEIEPGKEYTGTFKVKNMGKETFNFEIDFAPYSVATETYEPNYTQETQYTEISNWITVNVKEGTVSPGGEQEIHYAVNVPTDAHGGAQAGTIMVRMAGGSGGLETVRQVGYLVFSNVDGDVIKTGKILENKLPQFLFNPPIYGSALVENTGNVYTVATHTLQVFPLFSNEEVFTNEENPETSIVFPETKRLFNSEWEGAPQLGIFRVRHTVKIFDEESVVEKVVFLCPIWFLFIVILMIILIIFWIVSRIFKRKQEA